VHLDIAGPAMLTKPKEWLCEGGTGFGTQMLLQYFLQQHDATTAMAGGLAPEQLREALAKFKESQLGKEQE
jgi:aryl-alcohol dehydrogenase-like predicted oxidoreductase